MSTIDLLGDKVGPLSLQFPYFHPSVLNGKESLSRLVLFLAKPLKDHWFALEIRNKSRLNEVFADLLRKQNVAPVPQEKL